MPAEIHMNRPMDRPTSRILRLAAASIAVVAGTAVWPLVAAHPVAQALDNTPVGAAVRAAHVHERSRSTRATSPDA